MKTPPLPRKKGPIPVPAWTKETAFALQCLQTGTANKGQQQECLRWIIEEAALTYDWPFVHGGADGERLSNVQMGRMFVGKQIVKLLKIKIGLLGIEPNQ